jgi:uncharacterized protein
MKRVAERLVLAPTDLSNFLGCRHLSALDLHVARGDLSRPVRQDAFVEDLRERGRAHELAYLEHLRAEHLQVVTASGDGPGTTLAAMRDGVDVVYQATLDDGTWAGRVDFLRKVPAASQLGGWSYEVYDTKLARETKAGTILQLSVYSRLLDRLQGRRPAHMHVVTPGTFAPATYRVDDFSAYVRLLERNLDRFAAAPDRTYPELVAQCDYCAWWTQCEARRRSDDHLCYVAGISAGQIRSLRELGITTLAALAGQASLPKPRQGSREALDRVRDQARVQHLARRERTLLHELKHPISADHGLALLPEPTPDDIFLDFEGDHFVEEGVQEYLLGYAMRRAGGRLDYVAHWARSLDEERAAFEAFVDLARATRARNPAAHVYHFAPYEPAALKRLSGRYATRQTELDELLRGHAFVDLYAIVRRSLIASVERYSIKDLEPFFGYERAQDLRAAALSRRVVENAIATHRLDADVDEHRRIVEDYNREDCESAARLRDWLESLRAMEVARGHDLQRPPPVDGRAPDQISDLDRELHRLRDGLLEGVPLEPGARNAEQQARFALAHMMEFHRREDKASWWEYFRVLEVDAGELVDERSAVTGLNFDSVLEARRAPLQRYRFPPQELDARRRDRVYDVDGRLLGTVVEVNYAERTLDIKKTMAAADEHPGTVVLHNRVESDALRESLMRLGEAVLARGLELGVPYRAAMELLRRRPPPGAGADGSLQHAGEDTVSAAKRLALRLDGNVLAIQGPPGTGKTYTGAQVICALVQAGLKVGVTAVSHKVIVKLLEGAAEHAAAAGITMCLLHRQQGTYSGPWPIRREEDYATIRHDLATGGAHVVGATAWCWARREFEQSVDVLIVDEAGQMSLANVLATAPAGRSLILLGDPQQLEQPLQSSHPEGSEVSALYHLLGGEDTMPAEQGLFLAETHRLHPEVARFTSEVYYEGKVGSRPGLGNQAVLARSLFGMPLSGAGLRYLPIRHTGNRARAPEEVEAIRDVVRSLVEECDWRDKHGLIRPLTLADVLVVAPYNAQVSALIESLPELSERIGTVDRFQGQEAPVVIYSMTSSSPGDAPRGMEFLYNRFRFNVATSRAQALCVLVGSPALFQPECRTPRQMKMANGFCRYRELATTVQAPDAAGGPTLTRDRASRD